MLRIFCRMHLTAGHLLLIAIIPLLGVRLVNFMRRGMRLRWAIVMVLVPMILGGVSSLSDVWAIHREAADTGVSVPPDVLRTAWEPAWIGLAGTGLLASVLLITLGLLK